MAKQLESVYAQSKLKTKFPALIKAKYFGMYLSFLYLFFPPSFSSPSLPPSLFLPPSPLSPYLSLPPPLPMYCTERFKESVIEERKKSVEVMLHFASGTPLLANSPPFQHFITVSPTNIVQNSVKLKLRLRSSLSPFFGGLMVLFLLPAVGYFCHHKRGNNEEWLEQQGSHQEQSGHAPQHVKIARGTSHWRR